MKKDSKLCKDYVSYIEDKKEIESKINNYRKEQYEALNNKYNVRELEKLREKSEIGALITLSSMVGVGLLAGLSTFIFRYTGGMEEGLKQLLANKLALTFGVGGIVLVSISIYGIINIIKTSRLIKKSKVELEQSSK